MRCINCGSTRKGAPNPLWSVLGAFYIWIMFGLLHHVTAPDGGYWGALYIGMYWLILIHAIVDSFFALVHVLIRAVEGANYYAEVDASCSQPPE